MKKNKKKIVFLQDMLKAIRDTAKMHSEAMFQGVSFINYKNSYLLAQYGSCPLCVFEQKYEGDSNALYFARSIFKSFDNYICPWVFFEDISCQVDMYNNNEASLLRLHYWAVEVQKQLDKLEKEN